MTWSGCGTPGARPAAGALRVGEHDVPLRLLPPSRLVGPRRARWRRCEAAFEEALAGRCRGVLVGGAPGVGKTALVDELRPVVTGAGRLVRGGQVRRRTGGTWSSTRSIRRSARWAGCCWPSRRRSWPRSASGSWRRSGPNAGLLTAAVPEFAALLAVPPDPGDPLTAQVRAQRAAAAVLRAVASRNRPVVVFVDDLQWAGRTPLGFVDLVLSEEPVDGPAAGGRLPRRRRGRGASAGGAAVPVAGPGRGAAPAAGQPARRRAWSPWWRRCCTWTGPRRRAWPR